MICRYLGMFFIAALTLSAEPFSKVPRIYLWAWDRPEDLRFLEPEIAVAYFAGEIDLAEKNPKFRPRRKALLLPKGQTTLPVLHVRAQRYGKYGGIERKLITETIQQLAAKTATKILQLDFEVFHSQRDFYKNLILTIKEENPQLRLSITALASWCTRDSWLKGLQVAEIVPMLFDPSHSKGMARHYLPQNSLCKESVGLASYETYPTFPQAKTYYLFSNRAWRRESVTRMLALIHENSR